MTPRDHRDRVGARSATAALRRDIRRLAVRLAAATAPVHDPRRLELAVSSWGAEELQAVLDVLLSGQVTMGARTERFETRWARSLRVPGALMVNSGSSANLLALSVLASPQTPRGLRPGDEVIVPAVAWSTSVFPIAQVGCVPVFVDVDPETFNLDVRAMERAIGPKTRAVLLIHTFGNPCDLDAVRAIARAHKLWIIEDCCEAAGARWRGAPVGRIGDLSTFSFFFSHHLTTIEGGMVCFRDARWRDPLVSLRSHGWIRGRRDASRWAARHPDLDPRWLFVSSGYNVRPTEVQAALGLAQLSKLTTFVTRRRAVRAALLARLADAAPWLHPQREQTGGRHAAFGLGLVLDRLAPASCRVVRQRLEAAGIDTRPIISGNLLRHPALRRLPHRVAGPVPGAERLHARGFMLGLHPDVSAAQVRHAADVLTKVSGTRRV